MEKSPQPCSAEEVQGSRVSRLLETFREITSKNYSYLIIDRLATFYLSSDQ